MDVLNIFLYVGYGHSLCLSWSSEHEGGDKMVFRPGMDVRGAANTRFCNLTFELLLNLQK